MTPVTLSSKLRERLARPRTAKGAWSGASAVEALDSAFYRCSSCGHDFDGNVSTHVACPRCGSEQAW